MKQKKRILSWQEYLTIIKQCFQKLQSFAPFDVVYAPMRGGMIPAILASHEFDIRVYPINASKKDEKISVLTNDPINDTVNLIDKKVLIIDDIADSGETLRKCVEYLNSKGYLNITICTLTAKQSSKIVPDVSGIIVEDHEWVVFPYEI